MSIRVFGITGTNGKTTVSYMLRNILIANGGACGIVGTIHHEIGASVYEAINTTPGRETLRKYLDELERENVENLVMEVSSHGIAQQRISEITFDYGAFTNLSRDHLDYHKTMENYYLCKKSFFEKTTKANIVNINTRYGIRLREELRDELSVPCFDCAIGEDAYYKGTICSTDFDGTFIRVEENGKELGDVKIKMPGNFSAQNAITAIAVARTAGIDFDTIRVGLSSLSTVPGRFEVITGESGISAVVDYAHTPAALEYLLDSVRPLMERKSRLLCVFGCGGNRDEGKRPLMGQIAGERSDFCIITSDNPRNEIPEDIEAEIEEGIYSTGCDYRIITDRETAIRCGVSLLKKGDVIVIAGKGHEQTQTINDKKLHFSDKELIKELL